MSDTTDFVNRFKGPRAFGQMFEPKKSARTVYRMIRNGSVVVVDDPNLPTTIDVQATYDRWSQEGRPRLQRRQGRRASSR
jgi:hypothetical protein